MTFLGIGVTWWVVVGFLGQAGFFMRFVIQWIVSERKGESVVPIAFWYFSIVGGAILFVYAWHIGDPVFIVGQGLGLLIYGRNLFLIRKTTKASALREISEEQRETSL
ncbi:MAG: lipid A biosynthesis protein [Candidatus Taylorbacteria bacterium]|nr:lipid A biosynthesis protein [Candidatus Taylorbacteria bacterium]